MTQPPIDPAGREPISDASPTEPVPVVTPPPRVPAFAAPETAAPAPRFATPEGDGPTAAAGTPPPAFAFTPVEPEPGLPAAPVAALATPAARGGGSSRLLNVALGAAILIGAVGIAFAAGRATSPASTAGNVPAAVDPGTPGGTGNRGGNGNGNGNGGVGGGNLPNASFDLNGNGNGGPGDRPGDIDGGLGFDRGRGFGGFGLSGTVTAVTPDSITIQTDAGPAITFSLDGTTTYHQQADASASDVTTGSKVQITPSGRIQPTQGANGEIDLGAAGSITIVP